jgi:peptide methionine sulfoxide reductase MsrA
LERSVTTGMDDVDVERATRFYAAEQYHQNFLSRK